MQKTQPPRVRPRFMRSEEPDAAIDARVAALRPFLGRAPAERRARIARLLRAERRAAHAGIGYDAVRHAALHRLAAEAEADVTIGTDMKKAIAGTATAFCRK